VPPGAGQPNPLEEAEVRKVEAETTEIRVRTVLRAIVVALGAVALLFGSHLTGLPGAL
jgi:hypothetical protein